MMAVSILHASPAHAQAWRFLEKLSGPGNFIGYEVALKLFCRYDGRFKNGGAGTESLVGVSLPCIFKHTKDETTDGSTTTATITDPNDHTRTREVDLDLKRRVWAIAAAASYLSGTTNKLPYDREVDRIVRIVSLEESFDFRFRKVNRLDVGAAVGQNWFFPPDTSFFRWSVEPRVTVKLFDLTRQHDMENVYWGTVGLRAGAVIFSDSFNAADFGAIGPYVSHGQVVASIRFIVDFDRNPFKRGK